MFRPLQLRLNSLKRSIVRLPAQNRLGDVSVQSVKEYNDVLDAIIKVFPEIRMALPEHVNLKSDDAQALTVGKDGISYEDFEALIDEAIVILDIISPTGDKFL